MQLRAQEPKTTTRGAGRTWLCFRSTNLHTRERHVVRLAELVAEAAQRAAAA